MAPVVLYDTTLRDGSQQEGISLTVKDKLDITKKLDELGIDIVEGGMPGSNPKDTEYFRQVQSLKLKHARVAAFGSTRHPNVRVEDDPSMASLVTSGAPIVTLVGKSWDLHVTEVLETTLEENLAMLSDSISYLKRAGLEVHFDAEHFFDGFQANREYSLQALQAAVAAGVDVIHLCDTNGGTLPSRLTATIDVVREVVPIPLGIHAHNDGELAVANSLAAVEHGIVQVQGTINGYGERCGNANLSSIIPALVIKMGIPVLRPDQLSRLTEAAQEIAQLVNMSQDPSQPYVGARAFAHKAGFHAAAVAKLERSYEHMDPALVGNSRRILISELAGRSNVIFKAREMGIDLSQDSAQARRILDQVKAEEGRGFQYEGAESSFEMLVRRAALGYQPAFVLEDLMAIVEKFRRLPSRWNGAIEDDLLSEAMVKVRIGDDLYHTVAEGNGPVNAMDLAFRKALRGHYPTVDQVFLTDYKVRILNETEGTGAIVRVLIESTDGPHVWTTVGSSANVIWASWLALADSLEYWLTKWGPLSTDSAG